MMKTIQGGTVAFAMFGASALLFGVTDANEADRNIQVIQTTYVGINYLEDPAAPLEGKATVAVEVDENGNLVDWLLVRHSHRIYADAAERALASWRFEPAMKDGYPIRVRTILEFTFEKGAKRVVSATVTDAAIDFLGLNRLPSGVNHLVKLNDLDQPLVPLETVTPAFPESEAMAAGEAKPIAVLIDFYVDEQGVPRMPVIIGAADRPYALAAMTALEHWRFVPPTREGKPVIVRAQQKFLFGNPATENT